MLTRDQIYRFWVRIRGYVSVGTLAALLALSLPLCQLAKCLASLWAKLFPPRGE